MYLLIALIGVIFLIFDIKNPKTFNLSIGTSFLFAAIFSYKFSNNYLYTFYSFIIFNVVFYFLINAVLKKEKTDIEKNSNLNDYVNKLAIVKKDIGKKFSIDGVGLIEYNNTIWNAKSIDDKPILAGRKVKIISKENMIMNVKVAK